MIKNTYSIRARGPFACFTRPEFAVERVSHEVPTPSAARGVFDAILWHPGMRWEVREIAVLAPIRWINIRRNEVKGKGVRVDDPIDVAEQRTQRNTLALRDVDYVFTATIKLTPRLRPGDGLAKFCTMFEDRMAKGQSYRQPFFGCREFPAYVSEVPSKVAPIDREVDRPLGLMLYDFLYVNGKGHAKDARPLRFEARLTGGVVRVPPWEEVLAFNEISPGEAEAALRAEGTGLAMVASRAARAGEAS